MEVLDDEKEQLAKIKAWMQESGVSIVLGIALGLGGVYGWRGWQAHKVSQSELHSVQLLEATDQLQQQQYEASSKIAETLLSENPDALYEDMARLLIAAARVKQGLLDEAAQPLELLLSKSKIPELKDVARIRLAHIYMAQSKYAEAEEIIKTAPSKTYARDYEEIRGDIAFFNNKPEAARKAYQNALAQAAATDDTRFLQMKLDDLSSTGE